MKVLFLCTGNYYRSRFAEEYFNARAESERLEWQADSRALRRELIAKDNTVISAETLKALELLGITPRAASREPLVAQAQDFSDADLIIALNEREHRPAVEEHFPQWADAVDYWDVEDADLWEPPQTISRIMERVEDLIEQLKRPKESVNARSSRASDWPKSRNL